MVAGFEVPFLRWVSGVIPFRKGFWVFNTPEAAGSGSVPCPAAPPAV